MPTLLTNPHVRIKQFLVRTRFPVDVAGDSIDFCQGVKRTKRHVFHENASELMQNSKALFWIRRLLLFVHQLVELRILVLNARTHTGTKILIVHRVGVRRRPVVGFLSRDNPVNRALGRIRHDIKGGKK